MVATHTHSKHCVLSGKEVAIGIRFRKVNDGDLRAAVFLYQYYTIADHCTNFV